ncbi:cyclase type 10 [Seminavis robusta]|uniref:Cyclase type 10 n=1 Tax=Seminavis robusta TaxID=568900 RepID=A0A9N8HLK2_9STRA|nr:cyclase type 10 [Seminavis robusta]|eukprot:Sro1038_g234250.1 cyclase type 10 (1197) ;mRNA; f:6846-10615
MLGKSIISISCHPECSQSVAGPEQPRRRKNKSRSNKTRHAPRRSNSVKSSLTLMSNPQGAGNASLIGLTLDDSHYLSDDVSETSSIADDQSWGHHDDLGETDDDDDDDTSSMADDQVEALLNEATGSTSTSNQAQRSSSKPKKNASYNSLPELLRLTEDQPSVQPHIPQRDQGVSRLVQGRLSSSMSIATCHPNVMQRPTATSTYHTGNAKTPTHSLLAPQKRLESIRHTAALLFVDISGFTKLSRSLEVESLSKVINSYFQKIVEIIQEFKGDVLKFAGDALIVEWKANQCKQQQTQAPVMATLCAAKLVDACSDFVVRIPNKNNATTLLNIHCAIGFGNVAGTHVGNQQRMEYVICGDALRQIALAITVAQNGEVVASPETIRALRETFVFEKNTTKGSESWTETPQIIATKSQLHFRPIDGQSYAKSKWEVNHTESDAMLSEQCQGWNISMLKRLHDRLAPYVHPAVLEAPVTVPTSRASVTSISSSRNNHINASQRRRSNRRKSIAASVQSNSNANTEDAKLRDVLTIFFQPLLPEEVDLMSSATVPDGALELLQSIMMIVQSEAEHFGGQLRQFICDDKGLTAIVNFGLQGSTFPNMVEERAIPCISKVKTLLKTELALDCRIGATHGKAYCGVVGALTRHEYAVLGPSVNLAARLMGNKQNPGTLVDRGFKVKAGPNHPFRSLPAIEAKGYDRPVRIFEPANAGQKVWVDIKEDQLVGRSAETFKLLCLAKDILKAGNSKRKSCLSRSSSKMVFVSGQYGVGKSSLMSQSTRQIEHLCRKRSAQYHVTRHVFSDEDSFKPFSIVRPLFLDILRRRQSATSRSVVSNASKVLQEEIRKNEEAQLHLLFLQTCLQAAIPMQYIEMFAGLIFTDKLSDGIGKWSDKAQKMAEWNRIAQLLVQVYLQMTDVFELVVLALDDISGMDEFSWKIVRRLFTRTSKFVIMGASRNEFSLNIQRHAWDELMGDDVLGSSRGNGGNFINLRLGPLAENDIAGIACKRLCQPSVELVVSRTVFLLSEGNPFLATEILDQMYLPASKLDEPSRMDRMEGVRDVLLNRLDSLPSAVRLHLNCGAMLGLSFSLSDAVAVMEKYNGIATEEETIENEELVRQSLLEAEQCGFLSSSEILGGTCRGFVLYSFSHPLLREVISQQILQEWKDKIQRLIDSTRTSDYVALHDSRRDLSVAQNKPIRSV